MADTMVSALTAVAAAAAAQELPCNDAGTEKKVTVSQLATLLANPASDDGDALGSASERWSDIFLASTAVINFNNGNMTLTHSPANLTVAGGNLNLATGTTTLAPLKFAAGTNLTTAEDGAIEMDGNCFYGCTDAGNRGYVPVRHFIRQDAARALTSTTTAQKIFDSVTNGTLTLETGCYLFESLLYVTNMDTGASSNMSFRLLGGGTATLAAIIFNNVGIDANAPTTAGTHCSIWAITSATGSIIVTSTTGSALGVYINGTFEVTAAGTIIPETALAVAAAASVAAGSYFMVERIGSTSTVSIGQWT